MSTIVNMFLVPRKRKKEKKKLVCTYKAIPLHTEWKSLVIAPKPWLYTVSIDKCAFIARRTTWHEQRVRLPPLISI
jgi:hypothetical protein